MGDALTWSGPLYYLFLSLAGIGIFILVSMLFQPVWVRWLLSKIGEAPTKIVIELVQFSSLFVGASAGIATMEQKEEWFWPSIAGGACLLVWKVLQIFVDIQIKQESRRAENTAISQLRLLQALSIGVRSKCFRILGAVRKKAQKSTQTTINHLRETLTPSPQLDDLLINMATVLQRGEMDVNVRAGIYIEKDEHMMPVHGISLGNVGYNPFKSYKEHKQFYKLKGVPVHAHVVECVNTNQMIIVECCERSSRKKEFEFSHDDQKGYLKSMIAFSLGNVTGDDGKPHLAAIAVDAEKLFFFREKDRTVLQNVLSEFGSRICMELALKALLQ